MATNANDGTRIENSLSNTVSNIIDHNQAVFPDKHFQILRK